MEDNLVQTPPEDFEMVAKTLFGLEEVLAEELRDLGARDIEIGRRMVSFRGDKEMLYRANLHLRTALRVLKPIHTFRATEPDAIYEQLKRFDWTKVMTSSTTFAIDSVVYSEHFTHSAFVGYRAKDAIVDFFMEREGIRPSVRLNNPTLYINLHISHDQVTLSLDSSGESLHKRGYRVAQTPAPLNEVLAAGILLKAGWKGQCDLLDPMCGSGTFLIEAALIATGTAPGLCRKSFAFEQWQDFDAELFNRVYNDDSREHDFEHCIYGSDILHEAIRAAESNVKQSGMGKYINLKVTPLQEREAATGAMLIVMNPPYGERLKLDEAETVYSMIGAQLKHNYAGSQAWVLGYKTEHLEAIGLKHSTREKVMNGALECELRAYDLFAGKHKEYKAQGERPEQEHKSFQREKEKHKPFRKEGGERRPFRREKGERQSFRKENFDDPDFRKRKDSRDERFERKKPAPKAGGLWPKDRFRKIEDRNKTRFQVFRADEDKTTNKD